MEYLQPKKPRSKTFMGHFKTFGYEVRQGLVAKFEVEHHDVKGPKLTRHYRINIGRNPNQLIKDDDRIGITFNARVLHFNEPSGSRTQFKIIINPKILMFLTQHMMIVTSSVPIYMEEIKDNI